MKKHIIAMLAVLAVLAPLGGCATLLGTDAAASAAITAGVEFTVATYIEHKGGNDPAAEAAVAAQIASIAAELEGVVQGNVTVAQFNALLAPYIAKLKPSEQILANELVLLMDQYFQQLVSAKGSVLNAQAQAAATVVLNDVIAACRIFTGAAQVKAVKG